MQLIHINAILCHLMISNWIQSHCKSNLSEGKRKQTRMIMPKDVLHRTPNNVKRSLLGCRQRFQFSVSFCI